ncbi:polygalacturonase [Pyrenochaeta sp. MPI-SDFR-AT-0127]|nr:polygalacturonase [Pyrenochaeta sp. MPI-SDFR-AT-0127]
MFVKYVLAIGTLFSSCLSHADRNFDDRSLVAELTKRPAFPRCIVPASNNGSDDSPAILQTFSKCRKDSVIIFQDTTYNIGKVMKITNLDNVRIEIHGRLLWSTDIDYWLKNSLPIGPGKDQESYPPAAYQNQTTAFILGGKRLFVEGFNKGTFDGNGQVWYDFVKGQSNYPNRPHAIVITAEDSYFHGLRWVQPQMWTVTIVSSKRLLLEDIYINSTSHSTQPARNTDGANTLFSDSIIFRRWVIDNGDDCIALKANSTNVLIEDSIFYRGHGVAVGSIGQYDGRFEVVENLVVRNITMYGSKFATRIKTWTGEQNQWPPNGGGGGRGYTRNLSYSNITIYDASNESPIVVNQCYSNVGKLANCSTSTFDIGDVSWKNIRGTAKTEYVARLQCSRSHGGCDGFSMEGIDFLNIANSTEGVRTSKVRCSNVNNPQGFTCSS